ncbi:hypothetical protein GGS26DRAFT_577489 [Hypomontagnella submonticulosa]|nr:hypothetical protein GGS26DRAFT_577489 [Hypomontagnella submonticulosa]
MLEKTAASLEPCGFQRVIPGATQSFRTTRQLRTAFWQHGAADLELSTAWQALMHGTFDLNMGSTSEENNSPALSASAFLLDFLYPTGAVTPMRHLTPTLRTSRTSDGFRHGQRFTRLTSRLYTSSLPKQQVRRPGADVAPNQEAHELKKPEIADINRISDIEVAQKTAEAEADADAYETRTQVEATVDDIDDLGADADHLGLLENLLKEADSEDADRVWYHYRALDEALQADYLDRVLTYLSRSDRISDAWKISELFHKLPLPLWTSQIFVAGVRAEINLQNDYRALEIFSKGLDHSSLNLPSLVDALDLLLASALRSSTPELLKSVWKHYPKMAARWDFKGITSQLEDTASVHDVAVLKDIWTHYPHMARRWNFEGITSQLTHVASVPGLAEKALDFQTRGRRELQELDGIKLSQGALDTLQRILVRRALVSCADDQVIPLLNVTNDPLAFEEFLRTIVRTGKGELGVQVYQIYRTLPKAMPSHPILHELFRTYTSLSAPMSVKLAGLESLWGDWHWFHTTPSRRAFQRYLGFYASRGHTRRVYDLWIKYVELYRDDLTLPILDADDTFSHLLQVHAVQGEVEEAQHIFDEISTKFRITPNTHCWNILLNAYAKAGDYDGAVSTFEKFVAAGQPDEYSYGTVMQMAGDRGDLGFTVDLYRRAQRAGVRANEAILCSLVDAYCRNDYLQAAQDMGIRAAKKGVASTYIFNKLIHHYGTRRDLAGMNKILQVMAEENVPYDKYTYRQLLLGLSICRQSQHALNLLIVALKDNIFEVTAEHFSIVMGSLLTSGEPAAVLRLDKLMQDSGFATSSDTLFRLTRALGEFKNLPPKTRSRRTASEWLGEMLRSFNNIYGLGDQGELRRPGLSSPGNKPNRRGKLLRKTTERFHFGTIVRILTELREFTKARELVDLYLYIFEGSEASLDGALPIMMLNSIMEADFHAGHNDRVQATWEVLFETAKKEGRSADFVAWVPNAPKISAKYHYVLSPSLEIMQKMLFMKEDATGLQNLIREIREEGFEIDSMNWNFYIRALVQLHQYKEAFVTCEQLLMPNWRGWFVARQKERLGNIPLDVRRKGTSPSHLRPVATTLYQLARGYMELDQLRHWSAEAAATFQEIEQECVQVVRAIKSMVRVYSKEEYEILGEQDFADANLADVDFDGGESYEAETETEAEAEAREDAED